MRGYVEESEEVKSWRALRDAARLYASRYLQDMHGGAEPTPEEQRLGTAALAFAEAHQPKRRKRA